MAYSIKDVDVSAKDGGLDAILTEVDVPKAMREFFVDELQLRNVDGAVWGEKEFDPLIEDSRWLPLQPWIPSLWIPAPTQLDLIAQHSTALDPLIEVSRWLPMQSWIPSLRIPIAPGPNHLRGSDQCMQTGIDHLRSSDLCMQKGSDHLRSSDQCMHTGPGHLRSSDQCMQKGSDHLRSSEVHADRARSPTQQ